MEKPQPAITKKPRTVHYLSNRNLLEELKKSNEQLQMTNELAKMLTLLCNKYSKRGNFVNYTYIEDMQSYAMLMLVKSWSSFDVQKSNNPFAFFTQCIKNSFIQYLNQEKKHRDIRDALLVDNGMSPSFHFQDESKDNKELENELKNHNDQNELYTGLTYEEY